MVLAVALNLGFAALLIFDLVNAQENPIDYPFGAENCGWTYRSFENYAAYSASLLAVLAAAAGTVLIVRSYLLKIIVGYVPIPLLFLVSGAIGACD